MTQRAVYYPGGWDPDAPQHNLAEVWDLTAGTYTRWNPDGGQHESRPLTGEETAELTAQAAAQQATDGTASLARLLAQAIADNDTYLNLTSPTADQVTAQVRRLTRQVTGLARFLGTVTPNPGAHNWLGDITDVTTT